MTKMNHKKFIKRSFLLGTFLGMTVQVQGSFPRQNLQLKESQQRRIKNKSNIFPGILKDTPKYYKIFYNKYYGIILTGKSNTLRQMLQKRSALDEYYMLCYRVLSELGVSAAAGGRMISDNTPSAFTGGLLLYLLEREVQNRNVVQSVLFQGVGIGTNEYYKAFYDLLSTEVNFEFPLENYSEYYRLYFEALFELQSSFGFQFPSNLIEGINVKCDKFDACLKGLLLHFLERKISNRNEIDSSLLSSFGFSEIKLGTNQYYKTFFELLFNENRKVIKWENYPEYYKIYFDALSTIPSCWKKPEKELILESLSVDPVKSILFSSLRKDEPKYYDALKSFGEDNSVPNTINPEIFNELKDAFRYGFLSREPIEEVQGVLRKNKILQSQKKLAQDIELNKQSNEQFDKLIEQGKPSGSVLGVEATDNEKTLLWIFNSVKNDQKNPEEARMLVQDLVPSIHAFGISMDIIKEMESKDREKLQIWILCDSFFEDDYFRFDIKPHIDLIKALILANASEIITGNILYGLPDEDTLLSFAASHGYEEIFDALIKSNELENLVNIKNKYGQTPLHLAVSEKNENIVKRLLEHKDTEVNAQDEDCSTPLHLAVVNNNLDCVNLLLNHQDINVDMQTNDGWTPLYLAVHCGSVDIVKTLLASGANPNGVNGKNPLYYAVKNGRENPNTMRLLLGKDTEQLSQNTNDLINEEIIKILIAYGATVDEQILDCAQDRPLIPLLWENTVRNLEDLM